MEIFLVRHGETGGNVAHRHQDETTPLSVKGKHQVVEVAKKIAQFNPTHLLSSSLVRTVETASIIGEACDLIPETTVDFIELVRPKGMYGHRHHSLKSKLFYAQWFFGKSSDGESYKDLLERIKVAKDTLSQYPDDARVVVVTHSVFMSFFLAHICREKPITLLSAARVFKSILTMPNTHIIPLSLSKDRSKEKCLWSAE